jgi:hypothetical protein
VCVCVCDKEGKRYRCGRKRKESIVGVSSGGNAKERDHTDGVSSGDSVGEKDRKHIVGVSSGGNVGNKER